MIWLIVAVLVVVIIFSFSVFRGSPYLPSHKLDVRQSFIELYHLDKKDVLVDIGSGDGVILREATRLGACAVGYEINPILFLISWFLSRNDKKVTVVFADFWISSLPHDVTIVYVFSASRDIKKIVKRLQNEADRLGRLISVISYGARFNGMKEVNSIGPHHLYAFHPLQSDKAQV